VFGHNVYNFFVYTLGWLVDGMFIFYMDRNLLSDYQLKNQVIGMELITSLAESTMLMRLPICVYFFCEGGMYTVIKKGNEMR
jgi:hypothetical protein